ncbi:MAG: Rhodanese-like domain protein [Bryobacterales bacterium]|jgi:rhodanese-related sulfurtransferase|nr:Rhodanese-like domain protein [Bryobacterales bacterium]
MELPLELSPQELRSRQEKGEKILVIDVREPEEVAVARIDDSRLMPMQSIPAQLQSIEALADENTLAVLCHHGVRSLNVAVWLRQRGVENCFSITGGIDRWSREIDPTVPRY